MKSIFKKIPRLIKLSFLTLFAITTLFSCQTKKVANTSNNKAPAFAETTVSANDIEGLNLSSASDVVSSNLKNSEQQVGSLSIDENGSYTSKEEVALYIYTYHKLPQNYITKRQAKKLGWNSSKNYVGDVAKGKSIGGDRFSNYQKVLPDVKGRKYVECDIDYKGKKRNAKRIVYADDFDESIGFIYYTDDHYNTFEKLY